MHSLPHEIFISCQIFVPSTVTPCDVLIHRCVALDVGGVQEEKVARVAITGDDSECQMLLPRSRIDSSLERLLEK